jgi:hypothetical protein
MSKAKIPVTKKQKSEDVLKLTNLSDREHIAALNSIRVVNSSVIPITSQVSSSVPITMTHKIARVKPRKPILSLDDTFIAYENSSNMGSVSNYEYQIQQLHKLKSELNSIEKNSPNFAGKRLEVKKKQFEITKAENFLRKGRETGSDYRERQLAVLDAEATDLEEDKKRKAAEYRIILANTRIDQLIISLGGFIDKIKSETEINDKVLAKYKSTVLHILEEEKHKAKGIQDYLAANNNTSLIDEKVIKNQREASEALIRHLQEAAVLKKDNFFEFEEKRKNLSSRETDLRYELVESIAQIEGNSSASIYHEKETERLTTAQQESSPYETWLYKEAKKEYKHTTGKKFGELGKDQKNRYNKQYIYANRFAKVDEYEQSLPEAGKVEGYLDENGKTFELTGAKIKFEVDSDGFLVPTIEGKDISKLNAVVHVQRKRSDGNLSHVRDMIEFKDGKIVGFHLNTEQDITGLSTTSQLNVGAIKAMAKKLNGEILEPAIANSDISAPAVTMSTEDSSFIKSHISATTNSLNQTIQTVRIPEAELARAHFPNVQTIKLQPDVEFRAHLAEQSGINGEILESQKKTNLENTVEALSLLVEEDDKQFMQEENTKLHKKFQNQQILINSLKNKASDIKRLLNEQLSWLKDDPNPKKQEQIEAQLATLQSLVEKQKILQNEKDELWKEAFKRPESYDSYTEDSLSKKIDSLNKKIQLFKDNHDQQLESIIDPGKKVEQTALRELEIKPDYFFDSSQTIYPDYARIIQDISNPQLTEVLESQQLIRQTESYNLDELIPTINISKSENKVEVIELQPYTERSARSPDSLKTEKAEKSGQNIEQNIKKKLVERAGKFTYALTLLKERMEDIETAPMNENSYLNDQHIALKQKVVEYQENSSKWMEEYEDNVWQILSSGQPQEQKELQYQQMLYERLQEINWDQAITINSLLSESFLQLELSKRPDQLDLEKLRKVQSIIDGRSKLDELDALQELREEIEIKRNNIVKSQHSEFLQEFLMELEQSQNKLLETESLIKSWDDYIVELRNDIAKNIDLANKAKSEEQLQYLQEIHELQKDLYKSERTQEGNLLNYWHQLQLLQNGIQLLQQDAQLVQLDSIPELPEQLKEVHKKYEIKYDEIIAHDQDILNQTVNWAQLEARQEKLSRQQAEIDEQQEYLNSQGLSSLIEDKEREKKGEEDTSITLSLDPENMKKMEQWQQQKASFDRSIIEDIEREKKREEDTSTTLSLDPENMKKMEQWQQQKVSIEPVHYATRVAENLVMSELDKEDADIVNKINELHLAIEPQSRDSTKLEGHGVAFSDDSVKAKIAKFEAISRAGALDAYKPIINVRAIVPKMKVKKQI